MLLPMHKQWPSFTNKKNEQGKIWLAPFETDSGLPLRLSFCNKNYKQGKNTAPFELFSEIKRVFA